jgi:hypothetical protein
VHKDPLVRFNALFSESGWSTVNGWSSIQLDNLPREVLTLIMHEQREVNLTVPYRAFCPSINFNGTQQFLEQIAAPLRSLKRSFIEQTAQHTKDFDRLEKTNGLTKIDLKISATENVVKIMTEKNRSTEPSLTILNSLTDNSMFSMLFRDEST